MKSHIKRGEEYFVVAIKNGEAIESKTLQEKELESNFGKDVAKRIVEGEGSPNKKGMTSLTGGQLSVGGKGMKGFYGSPTEGSLGIVGNVAKSLFKQEPKTIEIEVQKQDVRLTDEEFDISEAPKELSDLLDKYEDGITDGDYSELQKLTNEAKALGYEVDYDLEGTITTFKRVSGKPISSTQHSIDITPELKAQVEQGQPLFMQDPSGKVLGFTHNGDIYLNGEHLNANTPIHEGGHIWAEWAKQNRPDLYEQGMKKARASKYYQQVTANKFYQDQAAAQELEKGTKAYEDFMSNEALAKAIGDNGEQFVSAAKKADFKEWLNDLWNSIKEYMGIQNLTAEELSNLTMDEFAKMAAADILSDTPAKPPVAPKQKASDESPAKRVKSLATELSQAEAIPKEIQEKIKAAGINGTVFSHEEAKKIAEQVIESEGIEAAVDMAQKNLIKGSVKAFIFGKAVDFYSQKVREATTAEQKEYWADLGAEVAEMFESDSENYGRFISAIGSYYKNHPDIIAKRELSKITKANDKVLEDSKAKEKIDEVLKEFEKLKAETEAKVQEALDAQIEELNQNLAPEKKKASDKAISALEKFQKNIRKNSYSDATGIVAAVDSAITIIIKAIKVGRSVSEAIEIGVAHINKKMNGQKWDEAKFRSDMKEGFEKEGVKVENKQKSEQEAILNKYFPKKKTESATKRKELHEKIIDQYNAGVFEGGVNKDGESFESLFYEKLGLINPNSKEVQAKIKEFADKLSKAPANSIMWRETNQDMLNYLANIAYETKLKAGTDRLSAMWYANILSSPATHLRNLQYNVIQSMIAQPMLLAEKALIKSGPKAGLQTLGRAYADLFKGLAKGRTEGGRVLSTGRGTRFDKVSEMGITDRGSKTMRFFAAPGRALRASDILFTDGAYETKLGEMAYNMAKEQNPNASESELSIKRNELLGHTQERADEAKAQAEKELEEFYGQDWKKVKDIDKIQKIREFEIMDDSMPAEMKEKKDEAKKWAQKGLLTNRPNGIYGDVADLIQKMNKNLWFTQFVMPFVNVPLNVANAIIERSPIGFIKAVRGKEGFGPNATNLTADEKTELMIKAANYSIMIGALAAINGDDDDDDLVITGQQTGEYTDNKGIVRGGGLEPYSVYVNGVKILNYKTTPWVAMLMPVGYARDYKLYGENKGAADAVANVATNYLMFNLETSSMMGMAGMFEAISNTKKVTAENMGKSFAKLTSGFIPYSGGIKYTTNTANAIMGDADRRPIDWYENVIKDIPFAQQALRTRKDHFGQPAPENFDIPFIPVGERGVVDLTPNSPYYRLTKDHKYNPSWSDAKNIYIDGTERKLTPKEIDQINTTRGEMVAKALDSKNVFEPRKGAEGKESEMTTMQYLDGLDDEMFKKRMDELFAEGTKVAKLMLYGEKVGITPKEAKEFREKLKKMRSSRKKPKIKDEIKNTEILKGVKAGNTLIVEIDEY